MAYTARLEALRRRFSQETDTSFGPKELAGLKSGKNQSAKELADCVRGLASRAYYSNEYASQEKAALHAFQAMGSKDLQLKCTERGCKTLEMAVATVGIQEAIPERRCEPVESKNQMWRPIWM